MAAPEQVRRNVTPVRVVAVHGDARSERADALATEEPLEIRAQGPGHEAQRVAVTMGRRAATSSSPPGSCSPKDW